MLGWDATATKDLADVLGAMDQVQTLESCPTLRKVIEIFIWSFPGGPDGKSVCLQCRRPGFNPWVRKTLWRRKWHPTPVLLPGKSHGWRSLGGYSPCCKESDTTEQLHFTLISLWIRVTRREWGVILSQVILPPSTVPAKKQLWQPWVTNTPSHGELVLGPEIIGSTTKPGSSSWGHWVRVKEEEKYGWVSVCLSGRERWHGGESSRLWVVVDEDSLGAAFARSFAGMARKCGGGCCSGCRLSLLEQLSCLWE